MNTAMVTDADCIHDEALTERTLNCSSKLANIFPNRETAWKNAIEMLKTSQITTSQGLGSQRLT